MNDNIISTGLSDEQNIVTKGPQAIINGNENNISIKEVIGIKIFTRTDNKSSSVNKNYNRLIIRF